MLAEKVQAESGSKLVLVHHYLGPKDHKLETLFDVARLKKVADALVRATGQEILILGMDHAVYPLQVDMPRIFAPPGTKVNLQIELPVAVGVKGFNNVGFIYPLKASDQDMAIAMGSMMGLTPNIIPQPQRQRPQQRSNIADAGAGARDFDTLG